MSTRGTSLNLNAMDLDSVQIGGPNAVQAAAQLSDKTSACSKTVSVACSCLSGG